jgi:hypothetical protein
MIQSYPLDHPRLSHSYRDNASMGGRAEGQLITLRIDYTQPIIGTLSRGKPTLDSSTL